MQTKPATSCVGQFREAQYRLRCGERRTGPQVCKLSLAIHKWFPSCDFWNPMSFENPLETFPDEGRGIVHSKGATEFIAHHDKLGQACASCELLKDELGCRHPNVVREMRTTAQWDVARPKVGP